MFIGPLIHYIQSFNLPHAQGCNLGKRTIAAHTYALEELGEDEYSETEVRLVRIKFLSEIGN